MDKHLEALAAAVKGIILDVDGVLTDGHIIYADNGTELKHFHVQDGASIKLMMQQGIAIAVITGRRSTMVERRCAELGIKYFKQGVEDKAAAWGSLISEGFPGENIAAVGDDLQDLILFAQPNIIFNITVSNAHPAVKERAHFITQRGGGEGVCVEIAQLVLTAQNRWPY